MSNVIDPLAGVMLNQRFRDYTRQRQYSTGDILLDNRIIFFGCIGGNIYPPEISDVTANACIQQMLYLQYENRNQEIHLYINSPGGSVTAGMSIYDTMHYVTCDVATYCIGMAASMAATLLAAGAKGKRNALPHAEVMIHQVLGGARGPATDILIRTNHLLKTKKKMNEILHKLTGQPIERIEKDTDRDNFMSAREAMEYGLVDHVLERLTPPVIPAKPS